MRKKRCKVHKVAMLYFYGWICPAYFPFWGKAPVTEFDRALRRSVGDFPGVLVPLELVDRLIIALSEIRTPDLPRVRSLIGQARSETVRARVAQPDDGRLGRIAGLLEQALQAVREPVDLAAIPSGLAVWRGDDD